MKINLLLLFLIQFFVVNAQEIVEIKENNFGFESIAEHSLVFVDERSSLTLEDVVSNQSSFRPINTAYPNFDFTTSSFWIKFSLVNASEHSEFFIEAARPLTNIADLYYTTKDGKFKVLKNGDGRVFSEKCMNHRKIIFPVFLPKNEPTDFYLHLKSDGEVITSPIKIWVPEAFEVKDYKEQFIMGSYYGLLLFVIIIYFFFYVALKEKSFLHYVIYVVGLLFFQLAIDGYGFQYLFPENVWLANHSILFFAGLTVVFVLKYAKEFLELDKISSKLNTAFNVFIVITTIITLVSLIDGKPYEFSFPVINGVSLISTLTILFTILWAIRHNCKVSLFFLTAFFFLIGGATLFILGNFNIIQPSFLTEQGIKLGSAFEVTFLSLTMANKFREIQQQKEKAQADLLEQLDKANEILEEQVKERTAEIQQQKEVLAHKNEEILDSITYAKGIQDSILPNEVKIKKYLPSSFVLFKPKDIVSGDFYWMEHKENVTFFTAADCTGHGVPGGFVSMVGANGLNRCVNEYKIYKPADILDELTNLVENTFKERKDGMDISLCSLNNKTNILSWAGAHNPLYIVSEKSLEIRTENSNFKVLEGENNDALLYDFKADKQPVAKFEYKKPFTHHEIQLNKGDRVYLLSDGFPDQFGGPKGKKFMSKKLKKILIENHHLSMDEIKEFLEETINTWMQQGKSDQIDDICIFGVEVQ